MIIYPAHAFALSRISLSLPAAWRRPWMDYKDQCTADVCPDCAAERVRGLLLARRLRPSSPTVVKADSRVSHLHNHLLQGTSLTAISCSLLRLFHLLTRIRWQILDLMPRLQANVPSSSKSCTVLAFSFDSLWFIEIRGTISLLCQISWESLPARYIIYPSSHT